MTALLTACSEAERQAMADPRTVSKDEVELFREAVQDVTPLRHGSAETQRSRPAPIPSQTLRDEELVMRELTSDSIDPADIETGEEVSFHRPGLQLPRLRKLRRGHFSIRAELDLHGMTVSVARKALAEFLSTARASGHHCVRIVHGKGHGSPNREPVLKHQVTRWLAQRDEVLAFCSARPVDGGTGALYVLLQCQRSRSQRS